MPEGAARESVAEPVTSKRRAPAPAAIIVFVLFVAMIGLSIWYLSRREPLVVQGEVQSRTFDLAARVDGRVSEIVVARSQDVKQGAPLLRIDNPELLAKERASEAALRVAEAELARVRAGFRAETIAARKAGLVRSNVFCAKVRSASARSISSAARSLSSWDCGESCDATTWPTGPAIPPGSP